MLRVFADHEQLSSAAAELFAVRARAAVDARGRFSVALSGAETPRRTYELLAEPPLRSRIPWRQVHVFWGDERCVPADSPRNNARMAREALLDRVPVPPDQVHAIACSGDPEAAAREYETLLRAFFGRTPRFDLILLGLGEDGHTASLFPRSPALALTDRWVAPVSAEPENRVTLTVPVLNAAALACYLVRGQNKAAALARALEQTGPPEDCPARLVHPDDGELLWLVDQAAATGLRRTGLS